jgi:enamine deaminase RidA (YjgF/YER057c/UK114 family)
MARRLIDSGSSFERDIGYSRAVVDGEWIFVDFPACWPVTRRYLGEIRPAATMISAGLADPRIRIEIEVTARKKERP